MSSSSPFSETQIPATVLLTRVLGASGAAAGISALVASSFDAVGTASAAASAAVSYSVQRGNHTGTQSASTITGLSAIATSGAYGDLSGRPTLGTAAALNNSTVGGNLVALTNPGAITFLQINADNSVTALSASAFRSAIGAGTSSTTGTVTSVGLTMPSLFAVAGSAVTSSGTFAVTLATQTANTVLAGPVSGSAAAPTMRALGGEDVAFVSYGNGSDGALSVGAGVTTTITTDKQYSSITIAATGTLVIGNDAGKWPEVRCNGMLANAGTIRVGYTATDTSFDIQGGAARTTVGAGNDGSAVGGAYAPMYGAKPGGPGGGGGDGTNQGGAATRWRSHQDGRDYPSIALISVGPARSTVAGANGTSANPLTSQYTWWPLPGSPGDGGGSGACKVAGGTNRGGAGGRGGRGGGVGRIWCAILNNTGIIHADGENGVDGQDAIASNASGDISGGGGAGGGGGGGWLMVVYRSLTSLGTVRAAAGAGGTGGLGKEHAGTPNATRATSAGGNGGAGASGTVWTRNLQ